MVLGTYWRTSGERKHRTEAVIGTVTDERTPYVVSAVGLTPAAIIKLAKV
jgi:hypothetical protein